MKEKRTSAATRKDDLPYDPEDPRATRKFWEGATAHKGVAELRAKRGRPAKAPEERKEKIALRVDQDVLEWFRAQGAGWQTRMNAALRAYRDASN